MKLSLFVEVTVPRPWDEHAEQRAFREVLEQVQLADRLGFASVWVTEHHFMEEYCHASAPEILLAALASTTTQIRLGHGIAQMPPAINHPARVAERLATLDLISNGRVEFGTGEASSVAELDGFRVDPARKRDMWAEGVRVATRCMAETPFTGFRGEFVDMPPRNVVPKPLQRPHPPLWMACTRASSIQFAAENGMGAMSFVTQGGPEDAAERVRDYYATFADRAVPIGLAPNANILCTGGTVMCAGSEAEALDRLGDRGGFFAWAIGYYYVTGMHRPGRDVLWDQYVLDRAARKRQAKSVHREDWAAVQRGSTADRRATRGVGTVDSVRRWIESYEATGLDELLVQLPPVRHEHVMESLERIGKEIVPELHGRHVQWVRAKDERMRPILEAAMARRQDDAPPLDDDYAFGGVPAGWHDGSFASEIAEGALGLPAEAWRS